MWQQLGVVTPTDDLYTQVITCYAEPHRKYHTLQHLEECLSHFEQIRSDAEHPSEVELSIWFHDAIYDVSSTENEQKSATWAQAIVADQGLSDAIGARVHSLIMVTKHDAVPIGVDAEVLVDVDLGILASETTRFAEYEQQVRAEYSWVSSPVYQRERRKILQVFIDRATIYSTPLFRERYEALARANLLRSLGKLAG